MSESGMVNQELFRGSDVHDRMDDLQSRLESHDLLPQEAVALLTVIHADLKNGRGADREAYARYARLVASLGNQMPEVYRFVMGLDRKAGTKAEDSPAGQGETPPV